MVGGSRWNGGLCAGLCIVPSSRAPTTPPPFAALPTAIPGTTLVPLLGGPDEPDPGTASDPFAHFLKRPPAHPIEPARADVARAGPHFQFYCTLEEMWAGCTRTETVDTGGGGLRTCTLAVPPGARPGTCLEVPGEEAGGARPLAFVLADLPHARFVLAAFPTLQYLHHLPLGQALTGCTVPLARLDGSPLAVPVPGVIGPYATHRVAGEGMRYRGGGAGDAGGSAWEHGDLEIQFHVHFPTSLSPEQLAHLEAANLGAIVPSDSCG